jgi:hypothetical protein
MSFGQQSGPPASQKQIAYLRSLLEREGHDFRTARHVHGLTQRQASGKFTTREASELIDRLNGVEPGAGEPPSANAEEPRPAADARADLLRGIPAELLGAELERRGWSVSPPG